MGTRDTDGIEDGSAASEPTTVDAVEPASTEASTATASNDDLRTRVAGVANDFLKSRLGLSRGLEELGDLTDRGRIREVTERAERFAMGFLSGLTERRPDPEGAAEPAEPPSATEVIGRFLSRASGALSKGFHDYASTHADKDESGQVVVDGRFVQRHGAPLLASLAQALGQELAHGRTTTDSEPAETPVSDANRRVDFRLDLPSLLGSLFVRPQEPRRGDDGEHPE